MHSFAGKKSLSPSPLPFTSPGRESSAKCKIGPSAPRGLQDAPRGPKEAPRGPQEDPKTPQEAQKRPQEVPKLPPRGPRKAYHEIPTNTQEASDPPRHGGGRGRRPVDTRMHTSTHTCMRIHTCMHSCIRIYMHAHKRTCVQKYSMYRTLTQHTYTGEESPENPNSLIFHQKMMLAFSPFRLPDAPRRAKRPPRPLQDGLRSLQESPKTA